MFKAEILSDNASIPRKGTVNSAGFDLYSPISLVITPHERLVIDLEIRLELPQGYYGQIKSRSSMYKKNLDVFEGTIDNDYRGNIFIGITNNTDYNVAINKHDRIAQIILIPYFTGNIESVNLISKTDRGEGGFGSTGI